MRVYAKKEIRRIHGIERERERERAPPSVLLKKILLSASDNQSLSREQRRRELIFFV